MTSMLTLKTIFLGLVLSCACVIVIWGLLIRAVLSKFGPDEFATTIEFPKLGETIYVKRVVSGGLAGSTRDEIFITADSKCGYERDSASDYYYINSSVSYYRKFKDTLELFVDRIADVPPEFDSPIVVMQVYMSEWVRDNIIAHPEKYKLHKIDYREDMVR